MPELMSTRWLRHAAALLPAQPYALNIGAWDGRSFNDPVYPLYEAGCAGLAIEWGDPPELTANLGGFPGVRLAPGTYVTPDSICRILADLDCPKEPHFAKVDIDGMDGDVVRAMLRGGYRPGALQVEVNPEIPPPYAFNVMASAHLRPGGATGFFGMSLQYACDLLSRFDYALVDLDFTTEYTHDALFVAAELLEQLPDYQRLDAREAFLAAPVVLPHLASPSRDRKESWRTRTNRLAVIQEMWDAMLLASESKHGSTAAPFTLYISEG